MYGLIHAAAWGDAYVRVFTALCLPECIHLFEAIIGYPAFENNSTAYTQSDVMAVLDIESMKESAFECERLLDLRRWGISYDNTFLAKVKERSSKYNNNFTSVRAWLPMPTDEVNNNPNLSQLPGW